MTTMAQNPYDTDRMAIPMMPPEIPLQMSPVDPHATLTAPIGPPAPKVVGMAAGAPPEEGASSPKMSALAPQKEHVSKNLMADYQKDADPYGSPDNHPGFLGKLLHGLNVATGGVNRRGIEEQGLAKQLQGIDKQESEDTLQGTQADKNTADTGLIGEQTSELPGKTQSEEDLQGAQTGNLQSEAKDRDATAQLGPSLATGYAHAVNEAIKQGRDPSTDPIVQHMADAITSVQPQKNAASAQPKPVQANGKSTFAIETPNGWVDAATHQPIPGDVRPIPPPPNYGQLILPTKTATFIDPKTGLPTEQQWDPKTGTYDKPLGLSATNAYGHEAAQAGAVERAGENVIADLQANRAKLGTLGAWIAKKGLNTPIADPTLQGIQTELASFAALNPAMHGARGTEAMKHFEQLIGGLQQNPDATIAGIRSIIHTAGAINPGENSQQSKTGNGPSNPDQLYRMGDKSYRYKGGPKGKMSSYEEVKQ